jgi:deoxycytidine triphosphate deaminase
VSVLARDEIAARLQTGDAERQLFQPGSWDMDCVRGAAYELRVSPEYLILPDGTRYWPGCADEQRRQRIASFEVKPGEVAFVSSAEQLRMPWDLAGNIAPKFRLALDGLLIMGGMLVDPGYGRVPPDGHPEGHEQNWGRLHFQVANLGTQTLKIVPNETSVAAIQLLQLSGDARRPLPDEARLPEGELQVPNSSKLLRDLFHAQATKPLPQLAFFPETFDLKKRTDNAFRRIETNEIMLAAAEESNNRLIVFGLFLIAITLLGVIFAALINSLGG